MSLTPTATVTLGNLRYGEQAIEIAVTLAALPAVNQFTFTTPAGVRLEAVPDDPAVLEMDGGEGAETVMTGKTRALRRGLGRIEVSAGDGGALLARLRPCATYQNRNAVDVVRALAAEAGVSVGNLDLDLPLSAYVAHQNRTAAEHIARLARLGGALAHVNGEGELDLIALPEGEPDIALRYGREILEYAVYEQPGPAVRRVLIGNGPAGSTSAPDALRPSRTRLPEDAPAPGAGACWQPAPLLRTPKAANMASGAAEALAAAQGKRVRARCFLLPKLRPGSMIEVRDLPAPLEREPWLITRVGHHLQPGGGGITVFEGVSGGAGAGGLLAAVAGVLG